MFRRGTALSAMAAFLLLAPPAGAAVKYKNCAALNVDYPHGIGRTGAKDITKSEPVRNFKVSTAIYSSLSKVLDRDKDGIACEKL